MKLLSLKLKNYRQFKEAEIEFPDGVFAITGLNGTGKSSLIEAIAWALFGNLASRTEKEGIKRSTAPPNADASATLIMEIGGIRYQITRTLRGARQTGDASIVSGGKIIADQVKGVEAEIAHILGMDYKSFFTSFFAKQKELNALTDLTPNQRKDVIIRMLRIDAVDHAIDTARKNLREEKSQAEFYKKGLKDENELLVIQISKEKELRKLSRDVAAQEKETEKAEGHLKTFGQKFTEERQKLEKFNALDKDREKILVKLAGDKNRWKELNAEQKHIEQSQTEMTAKEKTAGNYEKLKKEKEELEKLRELDRDYLNETINRLSQQKAAREEQRKTLLAKYSELDNSWKTIKENGAQSPCPTCQRPLDQDFEKVLSRLKEEKDKLTTAGKKIKTEIAALEKEITAYQTLQKNIGTKPTEGTQPPEELKFDRARYQTVNAALAEAEKEREAYLSLKSIVANLPKIRAATKETEKEIDTLETNVQELTKEISRLNFDEKQHAKITAEHDREKRALDQKFAERNRLNLELVAKQKELEQIQNELGKLTNTKRDLQKSIQNQEKMNQLAEILNSYRTHLISRIRPELSRAAGELFTNLTNNKYSSVELDENYEIWIGDGGINYPLPRFSGGEADLANLCLRLAISQLISKSSGIEGGFIILDEIFGSQDPLRKEAIMEALTNLSKQYQQIILITHIDDIKDQVENLIEVVEDEDGISRIKA
jgi:exonuclease SbcC